MSGAQALFTCMTCRVGFRSAEAQRKHFTTDWHRYNLKRKVANMIPVTAVQFRALEEAQRQKSESSVQAPRSLACTLCTKRFASENAFQNHLQSKKHIQKEKQSKKRQPASAPTIIGEIAEPTLPGDEAQADKSDAVDSVAMDTEVEEDVGVAREGHIDADADAQMTPAKDGADDAVPSQLQSGNETLLEIGDSLFCRTKSESLEANLKFMARKYGFFIPDLEYVVNLEGLIRYLQVKVSQYNMCLYCSKCFRSAEAARGHMVTKGHCFVDYDDEGQLELEEFYDYRPSYPGYTPGDGLEQPVNVPTAQAETAVTLAATESVDEGGAVVVESGAVVVEGGASVGEDASHADSDGEWEDVSGDEAEGEWQTAPVVKDSEQADGDAITTPQASATTASQKQPEMQLVSPMDAHPAFRSALSRGVRKEGYDLVLPSGARAGHRSLRKYYKQQFAHRENRDSVVIQTLMSEYKTLALGNVMTVAERQERRERDTGTKRMQKAQMRAGMRNNKSEMTQHYREQDMQW